MTSDDPWDWTETFSRTDKPGKYSQPRDDEPRRTADGPGLRCPCGALPDEQHREECTEATP